jgi:hypothetical protein
VPRGILSDGAPKLAKYQTRAVHVARLLKIDDAQSAKVWFGQVAIRKIDQSEFVPVSCAGPLTKLISLHTQRAPVVQLAAVAAEGEFANALGAMSPNSSSAGPVTIARRRIKYFRTRTPFRMLRLEGSPAVRKGQPASVLSSSGEMCQHTQLFDSMLLFHVDPFPAETEPRFENPVPRAMSRCGAPKPVKNHTRAVHDVPSLKIDEAQSAQVPLGQLACEKSNQLEFVPDNLPGPSLKPVPFQKQRKVAEQPAGTADGVATTSGAPFVTGGAGLAATEVAACAPGAVTPNSSAAAPATSRARRIKNLRTETPFSDWSIHHWRNEVNLRSLPLDRGDIRIASPSDTVNNYLIFSPACPSKSLLTLAVCRPFVQGSRGNTEWSQRAG